MTVSVCVLTCGLLVAVLSSLILGSNALTCFTCNSDVDPTCDEINPFNATTRKCNPNEPYCQKKRIRSAGMHRVERRCYEMCNQQEGVSMATNVHIDVYCCSGELCNIATTQMGSNVVLIASLLCTIIAVFK